MSRTRSRTIWRCRRSPGGHLTGDVHLAGRDQRLDGHPAARVLGEQGVEDRVADLVGDLVGVTLGDGLGGEQAAGHGAPTRCDSRRTRTGAEPGGPHESSRSLAPCRRTPGRRSATRSHTTSASASLVPKGTGVSLPSAPRTTAALWAPSKPVGCPPEPTSFTTSRSHPLRASLARPCASTSPVGVAGLGGEADHHLAVPGPVSGRQLGEHVAVAHQRDARSAPPLPS